ncbi:HPF/RaiA family ribosome-associated protein [Pelagibius litoralis]|uniref:HPF/RaiA family ribosome-associated protein n=1 Tax=Pelagibius litoralis TaxID=374515 RepID=A0A967F1P2_9PROT|nr:HPF/RaiA family ribosome-associated protein [Pelagibius litoralis]NIA71450.1 HPF/RaiA family ribosome-associated protein [Pelagibius litoralis]
MQKPLEISFRNMDRSEAVATRVREKANKLEQFFGRITTCRVLVEASNRRHSKGNLYHVQIEVGVPGNQIVVNRNPKEKHAHEDVYVAVRDAFDAARRRLEDHSRRRAGKVKVHEVSPHGKVIRLFPYEGYGFIETSDGQEVYFHRNSLVGADFDALEVGQEVRLVLAEGESEKGSQASTVKLIGKHHLTE